jgi:hypothetical protein
MKKIILSIILALVMLTCVSLAQATTTYITHYEDFNDQDEGAPENPTDDWYTFNTTGFTTAEVNNTLNDESCVFYVHDTNGDGAAVAYANFTVGAEYSDKLITEFSFYFIANAENLTKKEIGMLLIGSTGYAIGGWGITVNSSDMWVAAGDACADNVSFVADSDDQYKVTFLFDWTTGAITASINNLTADIASCTSTIDNTYLNISDPCGLGEIILFSDDNTSFMFDNFEWTAVQYTGGLVDMSGLADAVGGFIQIFLILVFWVAFFKMFSKIKIF